MGGPFWARKDAGAWTIPQGVPEPDEEPLETARREFTEVGQVRWMRLDEARGLVVAAQAAFVDRLADHLANTGDPA